MASSLSSGVGYVFESFQSIWLKIAQPLVVYFAVFRREVVLQSFYSAILIPPPLTPFFFFFFFFLRDASRHKEVPRLRAQSQAQGPIRVVAATLHHSHSNIRSKLRLRPTPQLMQCHILNPLSKARDLTCVLMDANKIPLSHDGNSHFCHS